MTKVWFITGASNGFGLALVKQLLENGDKVAATSRNKTSIEEKIGTNPNLLALTVDITDESKVKSAIEETVKTFGKIDVAVNNAGYMLLGALEEVSSEEFQQSMNVNLFAFQKVVRNVMPHFRKQEGGHFFNFASSAGYSADACAGSYNAAKSAVIGFSEALALEVKPFNVKVTIVSPGLFRTNFLGAFPVAQNKIEAYGTQHLVDAMNQFNGHQPGNPDKLVKILINTAGKRYGLDYYHPKTQILKLYKKLGGEIIITPLKEDRVDLNFLMKKLGEEKIDSVLLEGGGTLNYSALRAGIVDKVMTFIAPKIIGGALAKTSVAGEGIEFMKDAINLKDINITRFDNDILIEGYLE